MTYQSYLRETLDGVEQMEAVELTPLRCIWLFVSSDQLIATQEWNEMGRNGSDPWGARRFVQESFAN